MGIELNIDTPSTFNEKIQWLKLHDHNPAYTALVDKIAAKVKVATIIGEEHIVPILGQWDNARDIDFDSLPEQFVLKCNHDQGSVVIVSDRNTMNRKEIIKIFEQKEEIKQLLEYQRICI